MPSPSWTQSPFTPSSNANLKVWLDAHSGITTDSSNNVSQWNDQSTNTNNASQSTASKRGAYLKADTLYNSQPSIMWSAAAQQYLQLTTIFPNQPFTAYVVGNMVPSSGQQEFFGDDGNTCMWQSGSTGWSLFAGASISSTNTSSTPQAFAGIFNTTASSLYINNSQTAAASGNIGSTNPSTAEFIGAGGNGGPAFYLNGKIAEIYVCSGAHTASQVQQNFRYLAARYALSVA